MKTPLLAYIALTAGFLLVAMPASAAAPPRGVPLNGTIKIAVDATDIAHRVFRVDETIPVQAGPLTLLYPQWLPGNHSPYGPIDKFAGLVIKAAGRVLPWTRDPLNVYAFDVDVPRNASSVDAHFEYLSAQNTKQGRVVVTPEMLNLQWNAVTLYPAGYDTDRIMTQASVTYPAGWRAGTALEVGSIIGSTVHYKPIDYDDLVDSPIYAGKYFKNIDLDPDAKTPVRMDFVADDPRFLAIRPEQIQPFRDLVHQMYKLYGAHHYDHYDFLVSLSDKLSGNALEHHRSSEDGTVADFFTAWEKNAVSRELFSHEFNHSWNGKYRRGADLATPNFNVPMSDTLLWVYEGQTQFWDQVMATRSGLWTVEQAHDMLAYAASIYDKARPGLASWRNVQDTTNDPVIAQRSPLPYHTYQGSEDYYSAGEMIWLDVDGKLRGLSGDKNNLDDFARAFFGMDNGKWDVNTYTYQDVVKTLNAIQPFDWSGYLRERLDGHGSLMGGLASHGWKLVYTDEPSAALESMESLHHVSELTYSLGTLLGQDGEISDVLWDGPAFEAGLSPGMTIIAVNGKAFSSDAIENAIVTASKEKNQPIELLVRNFDEYKTLHVDYHGGLKYPHLVRDESKPDTLSELLKAR